MDWIQKVRMMTTTIFKLHGPKSNNEVNMNIWKKDGILIFT